MMPPHDGTSAGHRIGIWPAMAIGALVVALLLWRTALWQWDRGLDDLGTEGRQQLALQVGHLRGELARYELLPRLLARDQLVMRVLDEAPDARSLEEMSRYLETANRVSGAADTYLMDAEGKTLAASNWASDTSFVGKNFSYRPYFRGALEGEPAHYFALGTTSKRRGFYFSAPVWDGAEVRGVVVVKVDVPAIEQAWSTRSGEILVTDPDGVIFMSTHSDWLYRTLRPLTPESWRRILDSLRYPGVSHEALPIDQWSVLQGGDSLIRFAAPEQSRLLPSSSTYLMVDEPMTEAGWRVHLLMPVRPVEVRVINTLAVAGVVMLMVASFLLLLRQRWKRKVERRRFEAASQRNLEQSEARVRAILENTHAGLVTLDEEGRVESVNATARRMFSLGDNNEIIGRPLSGLLSGERDLLAAACRSGSCEVCGLRTDGTLFPLEVAVREIRLARGPRRLVTLHDVSVRKETENALREARDTLEVRVGERTADLVASNARLHAENEERVRAEQALREAQDQLVQAAKLASLGQMSASINHELNQPLAAIRTYSDNARQLLAHHRLDEVTQNLERIAGLTERMARISGQLKAFARKTEGAPDSVPVMEAVQAAVDLLRALARKHGVELEVTEPDPDHEPGLSVVADPVYLEQVIVNLLTNAIQAVAQCAERRVRIEATRQGEEVAIAVSDSGGGLDDERLAAIFEPFYTTKQAGLGLGLSISQSLMESMKGRLVAGNLDTGGAVFTAILPAQAEVKDQELHVPKAAPVGQGRKLA